MYEVTEDYLSAIFNSHEQYIDGTLTFPNGTTLHLDDSNIAQGSVSITMQSVTSDALEFGGNPFGELNIGIISNEPRYGFYNSTITLTHHTVIDDKTVFDIPLGVFTVSEATKTKQALKLVAYDNIMKLSKPYSGTLISGTPYDILALVCKDCGVELAENKDYYLSLTNGNNVISVDKNSGCSTHRDIFTVAGQMLGVFFQASRDGKITARQFHTIPDFTMSMGWRYSSTISDYICQYTNLIVTGSAGTFTSKAGSDIINSIEMVINDAPAWDLGDSNVLQTRADNLMSYLNTIVYTPSQISTFSNPMFDCGDMIELETVNGTVKTIITDYTWKYNQSMDIESVGKNPYLSSSNKSSTPTTRLINNEISGKMGVIQTYINALEYTIKDKAKNIFTMTYSGSKSTALVWFTAQVEMSLDGNIILTVSRDTEILGYYTYYVPRGKNVINFSRFIDPESDKPVALKISAKVEYFESDIRRNNAKIISFENFVKTGTYTEEPIDTEIPTLHIPVGELRVMLYAQGIAEKAKWDGKFVLSDLAHKSIKLNAVPSVKFIGGVKDTFGVQLFPRVKYDFEDTTHKLITVNPIPKVHFIKRIIDEAGIEDITNQ